MSPSTKTWIGQVTTGHGFMVLVPTLLAFVAGSITWEAALPLFIGSIVGLLWPENVRLQQTAQAVTTDLETAFKNYRNGNGNTSPNTPTPPDTRPGAAALVALTAMGLMLTACAGQNQAQQAATVQAVAAGLECIANTTNRVAAVQAEPASNAAKAAGAMAAVSSELANDPACGSAINNAAKAAPAPVVTPSPAPVVR